MACLSHASRSSCFQLFRSCDRLTRPLCSSPITRPSLLLRVGPPQCSASVLLPRSFGCLDFSLNIGDWFLQFRAIACIRFTPSLRRSPSARSPGTQQICSQKSFSPLVSTALDFLTTRHQRFTFVRLSDAHLHKFSSCFSFNAHHHGFWPQQLEGGLRPAPESRSRGALPSSIAQLCPRFKLGHMTSLSCTPAAHRNQGSAGGAGGE